MRIHDAKQDGFSLFYAATAGSLDDGGEWLEEALADFGGLDVRLETDGPEDARYLLSVFRSRNVAGLPQPAILMRWLDEAFGEILNDKTGHPTVAGKALGLARKKANRPTQNADRDRAIFAYVTLAERHGATVNDACLDLMERTGIQNEAIQAVYSKQKKRPVYLTDTGDKTAEVMEELFRQIRKS